MPWSYRADGFIKGVEYAFGLDENKSFYKSIIPQPPDEFDWEAHFRERDSNERNETIWNEHVKCE